MHFKKELLVLAVFFTITYSQAHSQSFSKIYMLHSKEDSLINAGKYDEALSILKRTVKLPTLTAFAELSLIKFYLLKNNKPEAEKHLKLGISAGLDTDKLNNEPLVKKFIERPDFAKVYSTYRKVYNAALSCPDERLEIMQMAERDMFARNYVGRVNKDIIYPIMREVDSTNTVEFKQIISRIGFPGIKAVGIDGVQNAFSILLHIFLDGVNDQQDIAYFEPIMKDAVIKGNLEPTMFALIIDRYYSMTFNYQIYGTYWMPDSATNKRIVTIIKDVNNVDKRRASIYLQPLVNLKSKGYLLPNGYEYHSN
jgi:hypothetical protein